MPLYLSNALYLGTAPNNNTGFMRGAPLIGWRSVLRPQDIVGPVGQNWSAAWSPDTYTFASSGNWTSPSPITLDVTLGNPGGGVVNYIGLAGHNIFNNARGVPMSVQVDSWNGSSWQSVVLPFIPSSGNALFFYFDDVYATQFRVRVSTTAAPAGTPPVNFRVAHIRMGTVTRLQRRIYVGVAPHTLDKRATKLVSTSDGGKYLGGVLQSVVNAYSLDQPDNRPDFVRAEIDPFLDHAELIRTQGNGPAGTFFCAWRPLEYPDEVLYCHPPQNVQRPTNQRPNGMMEWSISGEGESWLSP